MLAIQSKFRVVRKGIKSRVETKAKLDELKKQMETDFESKYKAFRGIDQGMRASEGKLNNLILSKKKNNPATVFKGNLSEDTIQQTLNHYSNIYDKTIKKSIRETDKGVKTYISKLSYPLDSLRKDSIGGRTKSPENNFTTDKLRTIATHNRSKNSQLMFKVLNTEKYTNKDTKTGLLSFN